MYEGTVLINSMTGFGRSEIIDENKKIVVEMKAVNHRYCDMSVKLPKRLNHLEATVRNLLKNYILRGKVDVYITYEDYSKASVCVKYNREIAREYVEHLKTISEEFDIPYDVSSTVVGRFPEVFSLEEAGADEDEIWNNLEGVVKAAAENFVETRRIEGENLKNDLLEKLDDMLGYVKILEDTSTDIVEQYKTKLLDRIEELKANTQIDEQRIATEVTLFADKVCVDEEIVRLKSHIEGTRKILIDGGEAGRKLDFIAQEMNREANTILSKAGSLVVSDVGINLKTIIEKIREQIQNIE